VCTLISASGDASEIAELGGRLLAALVEVVPAGA
jgi:hypothetical protein